MFDLSKTRLRTGLGALFVGAIALLVVACGGDDPTPTTRPPTSTPVPPPAATAHVPASDSDASVTITLTALNDSGQDGTATLTARGSQTEVVVDIAPGAAGVAQPIHIHDGTCGDNLGGVAEALERLQGGKSTTLVGITLNTLLGGSFAINGHKSGPEVAVYITCGNIAGGDAMMMEDGGAGEITSVIESFTHLDQTVKVGSTIVWKNLDGPTHTSTSGTSPVANGTWDTGVLQRDQSASAVTFNEVGTFPYFCSIHPSMQATVTVVA